MSQFVSYEKHFQYPMENGLFINPINIFFFGNIHRYLCMTMYVYVFIYIYIHVWNYKMVNMYIYIYIYRDINIVCHPHSSPTRCGQPALLSATVVLKPGNVGIEWNWGVLRASFLKWGVPKVIIQLFDEHMYYIYIYGNSYHPPELYYPGILKMSAFCLMFHEIHINKPSSYWVALI